MTDRVIDRIRKLLALADNAGSENEAALAASRAADLMARHEIHEAEVRASEPERPPEELGHLDATDNRRRVAWHSTIAWGLAERLGVKNYRRGGIVVFFGRLSAVQTASYLLQYLIREVERLAEAECEGATRSYRNAWRLGCAMRIRDRLGIEARTERYVKDAGSEYHDTPSAGALVVINRDREEVDAAYEAVKAKFTARTPRPPRVSSAGGLKAGQKAGINININNARGALPKGQGSLK